MLAQGHGGGGPEPGAPGLVLFGLYTGMRRGEIMPLRWEDVDLEAGLFRVEETKTGVPLELPVTRQLGAILARRRARGKSMPEDLRQWVFPSRQAPWGMWRSLKGTMKPSGVRAGRSSGFMDCATVSLLWPSGS